APPKRRPASPPCCQTSSKPSTAKNASDLANSGPDGTNGESVVARVFISPSAARRRSSSPDPGASGGVRHLAGRRGAARQWPAPRVAAGRAADQDDQKQGVHRFSSLGEQNGSPPAVSSAPPEDGREGHRPAGRPGRRPGGR